MPACLPLSIPLQVLAIVWAGSQVTKPLRVGGALVLSPLISRFLTWLQSKTGLKTQGQAAWATALALIASTFLVFGALVLGGGSQSGLSAKVVWAESSW